MNLLHIGHSPFCFYLSKYHLTSFLQEMKNVSMLNMFTFDAFTVCPSLSQSVTGVTLLFFFGVQLKNVAFH